MFHSPSSSLTSTMGVPSVASFLEHDKNTVKGTGYSQELNIETYGGFVVIFLKIRKLFGE